jgi:ferric-dicitrate binding protein FerR (iron transport regulator)
MRHVFEKARVTSKLSFLLLPAVALAATPRYARMAEITGTVQVQLTAAADWIAAEHNLTLPEGAWLRTGPASRAEVQFDDNSVLHLGPETQLGLADQTRLATGQRLTLISVERGLAYLAGTPGARDSELIAVPGAQVTLNPAARVRVEASEQGSSVAVLVGSVRFSSPAAELQLRAGQAARVDAVDPTRFFLDHEIAPNELDQWAGERGSVRFGHADLDAAGEWIETANLGRIWRPKPAEGWRPFQQGWWRWYDGLGYTWVSSESWGWLPYHYGRWTRLDNLGWVWVPSKNSVFKPGDVYWLRSEDEGYIGWGPLAPGEQWPAADPINRLPQEFLAAFTTFAAFEAGGAAIDPEDFERPEDPLAGTVFEAAPPSPPFLAARLESVRPLVASPHARVSPVVEGTTYETAEMTRRSRPLPPPPTLVVIPQPPPAPTADPETVAVPVGVPVFYPVVVGSIGSKGASTTGKSQPAPASSTKKSTAAPFQPGRKRFRNALENGLYTLIVQHLEGRNYAKALEALDGWTDRFHDTEYTAERRYFYMLAYNGLNQPNKVLDQAGPLFQHEMRSDFEDPMQALSAAYLAVSNLSKVPRPSRDQLATAHSAAAQLLDLAPQCLKGGDWAKARTELEAEARQVLGRP